jgi:hypothetical protein
VVIAKKLNIVIMSGAFTSADLGSSSNYSNEIEFSLSLWRFIHLSLNLKTVML